MDHRTDVLIVGGGLNGPLLALALAQAGLAVVVVDARPAPPPGLRAFDGRAYAIAAASRRMLQALDLWDGIAPQAQPIREIKASDGRPGQGVAPQFLHFLSDEMEDGPMGHMVEDRVLDHALRQRLEGVASVTLVQGSAVVAQETGAQGASATLADGRRIAARLIVGCDGRGSGTAARAGIGRTGRDYGQTALVAAIGHALPHRGIAHQVFLPEGPLAILPLPGGHRSSIVWTCGTAEAAGIAALTDADFMAALAPRFGDFLGALTLAGPRFATALSLSLADRWVLPRLALAGDAAHGLHPIAGQGLNLGLRDVAALAEVLVTAARRGEDIGAIDVLDRYQRWRRFDTVALAVGTDGVNRLFSNDSAILRPLRDIGMGIVTALPGLRRGFMRQAAGVSGDLPRLLRGEAI